MPRIGGAAKCNDVTDLWNCSYDAKKAFRCAAGKVAVETCDGAGACEVKPNGQDDVCNTATKPTSTPPSTSTPADPAAGTPSEMPGVAQTTGAQVPGDNSSDHAAANEPAGGCSVSRTSGTSGGGMATGFGLLALAGVLAASRGEAPPRGLSATKCKAATHFATALVVGVDLSAPERLSSTSSMSTEAIRFFAATDVGSVREHNEDNFLVDKKLALFVVADGMGGHAAGEVASAIAVRTDPRGDQARDASS